MPTRFHITTFRKAISALLLILPFGLFAQPVVSLGPTGGCPGMEIRVPVEVQNLEDIGNFTFYLDVDTAALAFVAVGNIHPALSTGNLVGNLSFTPDPLIVLTWFSMTPFALSQGVLFEIRFILKADYATLAFRTGSELGRSDLTLIEDVVYNNGSIQAFSILTPVPFINMVDAGSTAQFVLPGIPHTTYRWEENTAGTWLELPDRYPFIGVNGPVLLIAGVTGAFNNRTYRCRISDLHQCEAVTDGATLKVSATGMSLQPAEQKPVLDVYPNPANNVIYCTVSTPVRNGILCLYNVDGKEIQRTVFTELGPDNPKMLNISDIANGVYLVTLQAGYRVLSQAKVIREMK
jgi:hypothetical protein